MPEEPPPLEELYEPDILARIDSVIAGTEQAPDDPAIGDGPWGHGPVSVNGKVAEWARQSAVGAFLYGAGKAIEDVLRNDVEIAEYAEDPGSAAGDDRPVRLVFVPGAPHLSKAFVRPWLLGRRSRRC